MKYGRGGDKEELFLYGNSDKNSSIWLYKPSLTLKFNKCYSISCNLYNLKLITAECKLPSVSDTGNKHI